ncbi:MAG: putative PEP-binding protein [Pseudonocardia sp.]
MGLCRTEHMFLGDRRRHVERLVLADAEDEREAALAELLPLQRGDFREIFAAQAGLPVTIRLLDPPLHEFLPDLTELSVAVAVADERGEPDSDDVHLLAAVRRLHEQNPMMGLRGVRLGIVVPGLFALQVRAIAQAAAELHQRGVDVQPEIMVPLVGAVQELQAIVEEIEAVLTEEAERADMPLGASPTTSGRRLHRLANTGTPADGFAEAGTTETFSG